MTNKQAEYLSQYPSLLTEKEVRKDYETATKAVDTAFETIGYHNASLYWEAVGELAESLSFARVNQGLTK